MSNQIQKMWGKHHEIKRLLLLGLNYTEIAKQVLMTPAGVRNVAESEVFLQQFNALVSARDSAAIDVSVCLKEDQGTNLTLLQNIRDDDTSPKSLRAKIATDLLEKSGVVASRKVDIDIQDSRLTPAQIDEIRNSANEAKKLAFGGLAIIDAEFTEEKAS